MDVGLIGGIVGGIIGMLGGIVGTYASISSTKGARERSFMIKSATFAWVGIIVFLTLLLTLPKPYNHLMWVPYGILMSVGIITCNRKLAELRRNEDST